MRLIERGGLIYPEEWANATQAPRGLRWLWRLVGRWLA